MSKERKYQDHEIRQILDLAIDEEDRPARSLPSANGLTLVELQDVGSEREWELLIAELRMTFGEKGEATSHGGLREWSYGTLMIYMILLASGFFASATRIPARKQSGHFTVPRPRPTP